MATKRRTPTPRRTRSSQRWLRWRPPPAPPGCLAAEWRSRSTLGKRPTHQCTDPRANDAALCACLSSQLQGDRNISLKRENSKSDNAARATPRARDLREPRARLLLDDDSACFELEDDAAGLTAGASGGDSPGGQPCPLKPLQRPTAPAFGTNTRLTIGRSIGGREDMDSVAPMATPRDSSTLPARLGRTSLVSAPKAPRLELSPGKTGTKSATEQLYRSVRAWFTPAAFERVDAPVIAFAGCGANDVMFAHPQGAHSFGDRRMRSGWLGQALKIRPAACFLATLFAAGLSGCSSDNVGNVTLAPPPSQYIPASNTTTGGGFELAARRVLRRRG